MLMLVMLIVDVVDDVVDVDVVDVVDVDLLVDVGVDVVLIASAQSPQGTTWNTPYKEARKNTKKKNI